MNYLEELMSNPAEYEKFLSDCVQDLINQEKENEKFIFKKQDEIMELVYQYLLKEKVIDNMEIRYNSNKYSFSEKDFCNLCDNILNYAEEKENTYTDVSFFFNENCCLIYKELNIIIKTEYGQGTMYQMRIDLKDDWNKNKNKAFNYDEYKEYVKNNY